MLTMSGAASLASRIEREPKISWLMSLLSSNLTHLDRSDDKIQILSKIDKMFYFGINLPKTAMTIHIYLYNTST